MRGEPTHRVTSIHVFGSYLTDRDSLGDIDITIELERRHDDWEQHEVVNEARIRASGRRLSHIDWLCFGEREVGSGCLRVPQKGRRTGGKLINVPVLPELAEAIAATPVIGTQTFLLTSFGRPYASAKALGNKMAEWCEQAGLPPLIGEKGKKKNLRAHGLRKLALKRFADPRCVAVIPGATRR